VALVLSACTSAPAPDATPAAGNEPAAATTPAGKGIAPTNASSDWMSKLPQKYKDSGVLKIATVDGSAPWAFFDQAANTAKGVNADLLNEAAKRLGLTVEWSAIQFQAALPAVQAGRFDIFAADMADRTDRQEVVNFIDYSTEGSGVVVPKGNPKGIKSFADICGLKAMFQSGSLFSDLTTELNNTTCKDNPIKPIEAADKTATYVACASGQVDVTFDTYGVSNYNFTTADAGVNLQLELAPIKPFAPAVQGMAFSQDEPDLLYAVAGAMQQMKEDGTYQAIFDKWAVGPLALKQITVNTILEAGLTDFLP